MRSGMIVECLLLPSVLWAQALSPGGQVAPKRLVLETPPPLEVPPLPEPIGTPARPSCTGAVSLTSEVREHLAHPTPEGAQEAVRSQVEATVQQYYAMALMAVERQQQLVIMQAEGFYPKSQGAILKTLALAYGIGVPQDGLPPDYDLFAALDDQRPAVFESVKPIITWYHHLACGE